MNITVKRITDKTFLDKMTDWLYHWWGRREGYYYEAVRCYMAHSLQNHRLPQTYGLFLEDRLIGMYQFTHGDLFPRPDIYPWLANVYIDSQYRSAGYGRYLIETVQENAQTYLESEELFLFTTHIGLYEKFGWDFMEEIDTYLEHERIQRLYHLKLK